MLNIIHPYTFHVSSDTLKIGGGPEFIDRNKEVSLFIRECIDNKVKVACHFIRDGNPFNPLMTEISIKSDPNLRLLLGKGISKLYTTAGGIPVPDEKPEEIDDKIWAWIEKNMTSRSQFGSKIGKSKNLIFVGGMLESCVANVANYCHQNYREKDLNLFYIPEFCIVHDNIYLEKLMPEFEEMNFNPISAYDAFEILKKS